MAPALPPPCHPRSTLPTLMEELVEEILLRVPPDEPAYLARAALVCKPWHRILSDPGFLRRYHAFHRRRPPLLGFFYHEFGEHHFRPSFMPAAAAFPSLPALYRRRASLILDCRHGRVLLEDVHGAIIVWDPISDDWQELQAHGIDCGYFNCVAVCAVAGCDHHDCHGGPFLVVYLGAMDDTIFKACVYSSEARAWDTPVSYQLDRGCHLFDIHRAAVIGDEIYCVVTPGDRIIKYDLVKHCISSFSSPSICSEASTNRLPIVDEAPVLMQNEDGSLGLAIVKDSRLYLWSSSRMVVNREGKIDAEWIQERIIKLDKILPIEDDQAYVTGFAEGVGVLFISTFVGGTTFTFQLKSGLVRKITGSVDFINAFFPYISFFTPCRSLKTHCERRKLLK